MLIKNKTNIGRYEFIRIFILSSIIGAITGFLGMFFNYVVIIGSKNIYALSFIDNKLKFFILPLIAGILLSYIYKNFLSKDDTDFGVHEVYEEINHIHTFLMKPKSVFIKLVGTFITLLGGLSAGKQAPIVHLGGSVGSNIGYFLKLSDEEIKILILCGVSGALAGVFDEPIFASVFVIEVLLIRDYVSYYTPIMISSVMSVIIRRMFLGIEPFIYIYGTFSISSYREYFYLFILAIIVGVISAVYIYGIKKINSIRKKSKLPYYYFPFLGAIPIAIIGYFYPEIFDLHMGTTKLIFLKTYGINFLLILIVVKIFATSITLGSGGFGGGFMPGIFIGASIGGVFSLILINYFGVNLDYSLYVLMGMAAMFSGFSGAPLAATLMAVELSGSKSIMLPLFLVCIISTASTE